MAKSRASISLIWAAGAAILMSAPSSADEADEGFRKGLTAFHRGEYAVALQVWKPLAENEEAKSQTALGFMFDRGLGVPPDAEAAARWYLKAAEHGQAEGQALLGRLYLRGKGVPQNPVIAYAWCELALDRGGNGANGCRSQALEKMRSHEEMLSAFRLTTVYRQRYASAH